MTAGAYLAGLLLFTVTSGSCAAGAAIVVRRRLPHLRRSARVVAWAILFLTGLLGVHLVPGMLGIVSRGTVVATSVLLLLATLRIHPALGAAGEREPEHEPPASGPLSWAIASGALVALVAYVGAAGWQASGAPTRGTDSMTFHLPNVAAWIQGGSLWSVDAFVPIWAVGNYPQNGDVLFLSAVLPWHNDAFARLVNLPLAALVVVAVYALAVELRAPRATALLAGAVAASAPIFTTVAYESTMPELLMIATLAGGALFLLRSTRTGGRTELVLAGLALGLAFGSKWNGVPSVVAVIAVWAVGRLWVRRDLGDVLRHGGIVVGAVIVTGGFWLLRNLVQSGNPLIPLKVELAGLTIFDAPPDEIRDCYGSTIASYAGDAGVWSDYLLPAWRTGLGLPGLVAGVTCAAALLVALVAWRRGRESGRTAAPVAAVAVAAGLLFVVYVLLPYSAQGPQGAPVLAPNQTRYALAALAIGVAAGAWGLGRAGRWRPLGELALAAAVLQGLRAGIDVPTRTAVLIAALVVLGGLAAAVAARRGLRPPRPAVIAAGALVGLVLVAAGHQRQQDFNAGRYAGELAATDWILRHAPSGHRIALAGSWPLDFVPIYAAFGPELRNEVVYVAAERQKILREFTRRSDWVAALRRERAELLVVGGVYDEGCSLPGSETDENAWARAEGFPVLAHGEGVTLYRVPPAG